MKGAAAAFVVAAAMLCGCAGLATGSDVRARQPISNVANPALDVEPPAPVAGESPYYTVSDFLRAGASLEDDYALARQYLTPALAASWHPTSGPHITTGEGDFRVDARNVASVQASAIEEATMDGSGHVVQVAPTRRVRASFGLQKVAGQWRVSRLPAGFRPWISSLDLAQHYTAQPVYYPRADAKVLVPDVQWYPTSGLATALARAVLSRPPSWLAPVVRPPVDQRIKLAIDSVPINRDSGVASIGLTPAALTADESTRAGLWAAMSATLAAAPSVSGVELTVAGNRLPARGLGAGASAATDLGYDVAGTTTPDQIERRGQTLSWQDANGDGVTPARPRSNAARVMLPTIGARWYQLAGVTSGRTLAALSTDRRTVGLWSRGTTYEVPTFAGNLTRPSFTGTYLLVAGADGSGAGVWSIDTATQPSGPGSLRARRLAAPWVGTSTVLALRVSVEGARVALVLRDAKGATTVRVAALVRDGRGRPVSIGTPADVPVSLSGIDSVAWLNDGALAVLGTATVDGKRTPALAQLPLSGESATVQTPAGVRDVVTTGVDGGDLYVSDDTGSVWVREGASWSRIPGASDVVAPGT